MQAAGIKLGSSLMGLCSLLAGIIIAFVYSWKLTLLIIAFLPLVVIGGAMEMKMMAGAAGKNKEALEAAGKVSEQGLVSIWLKKNFVLLIIYVISGIHTSMQILE